MDTMLVDCSGCGARGAACADCVVSVLLGAPAAAVGLAPAEVRALGTMAACGLLPPLRLAPTRPTRPRAAPPGGRTSAVALPFS